MVALAKLQPNMWNEPVQVERGQIWQLGRHRVCCGDSTNAEDVARLMQGEKAVLCMADPPYGMGKEKDGVANDNLYDEKLDAFQMRWWNVARPHLTNNASAYIWGNAESLWRLWYSKLKDSERLTFRNEIVWNKGAFGSGGGTGVGQAIQRSYFPATERCLFFMLGEQGFNENADNYWEEWEAIRAYLWEECQKAGLITSKKYNEVLGFATTGSGMFQHHVGPMKSQWFLLKEEYYERLQKYAQGQAFTLSYSVLKSKHSELKEAFYATRAYFDNTHENMTDVWAYPRVTGKERYGHPTPKPVAMIERIIKTSSPADSLTYDPFLGSGTSIISAENTGRRVYGLEINEAYCETIIERWQEATGQQAQLLSLWEVQP